MCFWRQNVYNIVSFNSKHQQEMLRWMDRAEMCRTKIDYGLPQSKFFMINSNRSIYKLTFDKSERKRNEKKNGVGEQALQFGHVDGLSLYLCN